MTDLEKVTQKLDELGTTFAEYKDAQEKRIKEIESTGKVSDELNEKLEGLSKKLTDMDGVKAEFDALVSRMDKVEAGQQDPGKTQGDDPRVQYKGEDALGQQLHDVWKAETDKIVDQRLTAIKAATGLNESQPSDGGFAVQTDQQTTIMKRMYELGEVLRRVRRIPISANSNALTIPGEDETSRKDGSRRGGVQSYWTEEAGEKTASRPKLRQMDLKLKKLTALIYVTDELLQDASALTAYINEILPEELNFKTEAAIFAGDGAGKPLGLINSPAVIEVPKDSGTGAGTIGAADVINMWARLWARSQKNAVWYINQDCLPSLIKMELNDNLLFMPPRGLVDAPYGTLFGRPVIPVEYCKTCGTPGDIVLCDPTQYMMIDKGGIQSASSIHVRFVYDETAFRFTYRCDGGLTWHSALTPYEGSATQSPVITLAVRE